MKKFLLTATILMALTLPAAAQEGISLSSSLPVDISADKSLEWNRNNKTYTARGNAIAVQGQMKVSAATLTARYSDDNGATDIQDITADTGVVIQSPPYTAYGDRAVYTVASGNAVLTGKDLRIVTDTEKLTAKDKITFLSTEKKMTASGGATAVRGTDTLTAQTLTAYFTEDKNGKMGVDKIIAENNVTITTAQEKVFGDHGVYNIPAQKATLTGNVRVMQGPNTLVGSRAETDLRTGISKLFADTATPAIAGQEPGITPISDGRVRGVFYPKSQKK